MDKETLSNYGWIVICVMVLAVMLALATPFGSFIAGAIQSTTQGLFDVNQGALDAAGIEIMQQEFDTMLNGSGQNGEDSVLNHKNIIPEGGIYYVGVPSAGTVEDATAVYTAGQEFPATMNDGDLYEYGDYIYDYIPGANGWNVETIELNQTTYGAILESINGKPITHMMNSFSGCQDMITAPEIPDSVIIMYNTFVKCSSLKTAPEIPYGVTEMYRAFMRCTSLEVAPHIPSTVTSALETFNYCTSLTDISLPCSQASKDYTYKNCPAPITYYHVDGCDGSCGK